MHLDLATVTDLLHELEACQPDAQVRLAQQPPGRSGDAITPAPPRPRSTWTPPAWPDLGQGAQLGHLPEPARNQLGS